MGRRLQVSRFDDETSEAILMRRNVITKAEWHAVKCKYCGSAESVYRFGFTKKGVQRYQCTKCDRTFLDNAAPERRQYPAEVIALALNDFYEGSSIPKIQRKLQLQYGLKPGFGTIYRWLVEYSGKAAKNLKEVPIKSGSTWVADETVIRLKAKGGSKQWFWDIIDDKTRFLLASHLSESRGSKDAQILMERAAERADKIPKVVVTDRLKSYLDGVELAFGADTKHVAGGPFKVEGNTNLIERFHGTLKERTKVMRSMLRRGTAKIVTDGWLVHYNFFRPHQTLKGQTPAEAAGAEPTYRSWKDVVIKP